MVGLDENARRGLPSVSRLIESDDGKALLEHYPRQLVTDAVRAELAAARAAADNGRAHAAIMRAVDARLRRASESTLRPVINATGVILHTNLGRAPLSEATIRAMEGVARSYSSLEYDLDAGARGSRHEHASELLRRLTGAEAALIVNNNASAVMLALAALASGREVV